MRFDVRLPSSGQDRWVWVHGWAASHYTSKIQMLCVLLTFIRVMEVNGLMKRSFFKTSAATMVMSVQPEVAPTYDPRLRS